MNQREKLIEILSRFHECLYDETMDCNECDYKDVGECCDTRLADYLIANGVVVLPCRCCECINRHNEVICPMVISHESFDEDDGYDVWYEDLTTDDFYCANGERKGGDE